MLTNDSKPKRSPAWSPHGKVVAFAQEHHNTYQIFLLGAQPPRQLTIGSDSKDRPAFNGSGSEIYYISGGSIRRINRNGASMKVVYPPPRTHSNAPGGSNNATAEDTNVEFHPPIRQFSWSQNGSSLAAILETQGENAVIAGRADWWQHGKAAKSGYDASHSLPPETVVIMTPNHPKPFLLFGGQRAGVAWSPDSIHLAVATVSVSGYQKLIVFRADHPDYAPHTLLSAAPYTIAAMNPVWSPDGSKIAFEVWRMESPDNRRLLGIAVMPTNLAQPVVINNTAEIGRIPIAIKGAVTDPQWSPDGKQLLYLTSSGSGRDIWVVNSDGSDPHNLTHGGGDNFDPAWSPIPGP